MISPELTLEESFEQIEDAIEGMFWSIPMEFTLRYSGLVPHRSAKSAHAIRIEFERQLADYWTRDTRLAKVKRERIQPAKRSSRAVYDVRGDGEKLGRTVADRYYFNEVNGVRFVPLVTAWRYLRCELRVRMYRHEGAMTDRGGIIDHNGDLDNKCKALLDALRMPSTTEAKAIGKYSNALFFCLLEDDRLVTHLSIDMKQKLGPRPSKADVSLVDVDVDVRIYPAGMIKTMNYEMLLP